MTQYLPERQKKMQRNQSLERQRDLETQGFSPPGARRTGSQMHQPRQLESSKRKQREERPKLEEPHWNSSKHSTLKIQTNLPYEPYDPQLSRPSSKSRDSTRNSKPTRNLLMYLEQKGALEAIGSSSLKAIAPATTTNAMKYESDIYFDGNMFGVNPSASKQLQQSMKTIQQRRGITGLATKAVSSILSRKFSSPANYQDSFMNKVPPKPRTPSVKQRSKLPTQQQSIKTEKIVESVTGSQSNVNLGIRYKNSFQKPKGKEQVEQLRKKPIQEAYNRTEIEAIAKTLSSMPFQISPRVQNKTLDMYSKHVFLKAETPGIDGTSEFTDDRTEFTSFHLQNCRESDLFMEDFSSAPPGEYEGEKKGDESSKKNRKILGAHISGGAE